MAQIIARLKSAAQWFVENPWAILTALAGVFGAYLLLKRKDNKISSLKDAVAVQATKAKIAADEREAQMLVDAAEGKEAKVREIDDRIAASKRRILEINEGKRLDGASDEEIAALFSDSGL